MERPSGQPRLFTLEEATALLPRVRELVQHLQQTAAALSQAQTELMTLGETAQTNGHATNGHGKGSSLSAALERADALVETLRATMRDFEAIGCELKDVQMGLVDFRALRDGREVYLCWRLGEDEIRFWHELNTGFQSRQPL